MFLNCFKVFAAGPSIYKLSLCSRNQLSTEFETIKVKLHSKIANAIFTQKKMYVFEFDNVCIQFFHVFMTLDLRRSGSWCLRISGIGPELNHPFSGFYPSSGDLVAP